MACAYSLPADKLKALAVICGLGTSDMGHDGMSWVKWAGYKYIRWIPSSLLQWFWRQDPGSHVYLSPDKHLELLRSCAAKAIPHEREAGLFTTEDSIRLWLKTSREAFKHGVDAAVQDTLRLGSDWKFRIEDVRRGLPAYLWYGTFDDIAPVSHGKQTAARLGERAHLRIVNETHGSMFANQTQAYLTDIVNCMNEKAGVSD